MSTSRPGFLSYGRRLAVLSLLLMVTAGTAFANPFLSPSAGAPGATAPAPVAVAGGAGHFVGLQLSLRDRIASVLESFKAKPSALAIATILLGAFLYGILHAAGPGHRKTIVFSLFLTRSARAWEPAAAGVLSAGLHAGTTLALIGGLSLASGRIARLAGVTDAGTWIEGSTLLLLAVAALLLVTWTIVRLARHSGHADSGTGRSTNLYLIVAGTSAIPCPGAMMVMFLALYLGLPLLGFAAVLAMSTGMALVVSAAGYLAWAGRSGLFLRLKKKGASIDRLSLGLELASYLFLLAFSLWAAWPFLLSVV